MPLSLPTNLKSSFPLSELQKAYVFEIHDHQDLFVLSFGHFLNFIDLSEKMTLMLSEDRATSAYSGTVINTSDIQRLLMQ